MGALHEVYGEQWREYLGVSQLTAPFGTETLNDRQRALLNTVSQAEAACTTAGNWPPAPEELAAFERSLRGVRVGG